jgi:CheY-like chemotaxis protein
MCKGCQLDARPTLAEALSPMKRTVLVIDDDSDIRETMHVCLGDEGFRVVCACDGAEALAQLREGLKPDVILLDLMMPVMSGWQFRQEQLRDEQLAPIPVIVISADSNLREKAHPFGGVYLQKPLDVDELVRVIGGQVERAKG